MSITIRALEPEDLEVLYQIENDDSLWQFSDSYQPFSRYILRQYIKDSHKSIYETHQFRWAICNDDNAIGFIDLYNFDVRNSRAYVAIAILPNFRRKGYGKIAHQLLEQYVFKHLGLHQIVAEIVSGNEQSEQFFINMGYSKMAVLKDWCLNSGIFKDVLLYRLTSNS